jgi:hypothetical protein
MRTLESEIILLVNGTILLIILIAVDQFCAALVKRKNKQIENNGPLSVQSQKLLLRIE